MDQMTEQDTNVENNEQHLDQQVDGGDIQDQNPPVQPAANELDWKLLYAQSIRERQQREEELAQLRAQLSAPRTPEQQEEDITDADIEKYGTTGVIKKIVAQTLRNELSSSLGDVKEISRDFKRNKMVEQSENAFFNNFPHLQQYREVLGPTIRGQLQNAQHIDPSVYATQAFATIGYYTAMNAANPAPQQNTPVNNNPPRQVPPNRVNGTPPNTRSAPRLSELERTAMRRAGFDPNKADDVQRFLDIVNNDEGITV